MFRKMMIGVLLLITILATGCDTFLPFRPLASVNGSRITLDAGSHHIEGVLGTQYIYQFLLKDEGISVNAFSGDAFVTMLPLVTADQLRVQYGDFFQCDNPGASQAQQQTQMTVLIASSAEAKQAISKAMRLVKKSQIPVISFTGSLVQVVKHTYLDMDLNDGGLVLLYYVNDLSIIKEDC